MTLLVYGAYKFTIMKKIPSGYNHSMSIIRLGSMHDFFSFVSIFGMPILNPHLDILRVLKNKVIPIRMKIKVYGPNDEIFISYRSLQIGVPSEKNVPRGVVGFASDFFIQDDELYATITFGKFYDGINERILLQYCNENRIHIEKSSLWRSLLFGQPYDVHYLILGIKYKTDNVDSISTNDHSIILPQILNLMMKENDLPCLS